MRIGIIVDRIFPSYKGGYEIQFFKIAEYLSKENQVNVFTAEGVTKNENSLTFFKVSPHYVFVNRKGVHNFHDHLKFTLKLKRKLMTNPMDCYIINGIPYLLIPSILSQIKTKKIVVFQEAWYQYLNRMHPLLKTILRRQIKKIVENTDLVVAGSNSTMDSLIKNYKCKNIVLIPNGIDPVPSIIEKTAKKYDIIYMGRIVSIKHLEHLLEAVLIIKKKMPNVSVVIAGEGPLKEKLISLTDKLGINNSVKFIGNITEELKYKFLASGKIFVLPSEREGFSISSLEAMGCGTVPIVSMSKFEEVCGFKDFVIDRQTGLLYNYGNIEELSNKILELLQNDILYKKLRENALEVSKNYEWNKILPSYLGVVNKLLSDR